jgi:hypothetical protein
MGAYTAPLGRRLNGSSSSAAAHTKHATLCTPLRVLRCVKRLCVGSLPHIRNPC